MTMLKKKVNLLRRSAFSQELSTKSTEAIKLNMAKWKDVSKQIFSNTPDLVKRQYFESLPHENDTDGGSREEYCDVTTSSYLNQ